MTDKDLSLLNEYLDGALPAPARAALEKRLGEDAALARHLEELRAVRASFKEIPPLAPPEAFYARVMRDIDQPPAPPPALRFSSWKIATALGLMLVVTVITRDLRDRPLPMDAAKSVDHLMKMERSAPSPIQMLQAPAATRQDAPTFNQAPKFKTKQVEILTRGMAFDTRITQEQEYDQSAGMGGMLPVPGDGPKTKSIPAPLRAEKERRSQDRTRSVSLQETPSEYSVAAPVESIPLGTEKKKSPWDEARAEDSLDVQDPDLYLGGAGPGASLKGLAAEKPAVTGKKTKDLDVSPNWSGPHSAVEAPETAVVQSASAWKALWTRHAPGTAVPAVDFTRWTAVAVFAGEKPSGGYRVEILPPQESAGEITLSYRVLPPPADTFVPSVLTHPFRIRLIPKTNKPVRFQRLK